jgi:signal transduction histidine kinase/ligand-binding sensor domain-containing protein
LLESIVQSETRHETMSARFIDGILQTQTKLMRSRTWRALLCYILLGVTDRSFGVEPTTSVFQYAHTAWRLRQNGLMAAPISVAQTADGYIWFGTMSGLYKFDGAQFTRWTEPDDVHFPDFRILTLYASRDGDLFFPAGTRGVVRMHGGHAGIIPSDHYQTSSLAKDSQGVLWVAANTYESDVSICRVNPKQVDCFGVKDGLPCPGAFSVMDDGNGALWIGAPESICHWKPGTQAAVFALPHVRHLQTEPFVAAFAMGKDGSVWAGNTQVGAGHGLLRLENGRWNSFVTSQVDGRTLSVRSLLIDHHGSLWIGTVDKGLYRIRNGALEHFDTKDGLTGSAISQIFEDREGNIFVVNPQGIDQFRDYAVLSYSESEGLPQGFLTSVATTANGDVWVGARTGLYIRPASGQYPFKRVTNVPLNEIEDLFRDSTGSIWAAGAKKLAYFRNGHFELVQGEHGQTDIGPVFEILEDAEHQIWVMVDDQQTGRAWLRRVQNGAVTESYPWPDSSRRHFMTSARPNPAGGIWATTMAGELAWFHQRHFDLLSLPPQIGHVLAAEPDASGLWLKTDLHTAYLQNGAVHTLSTNNGLPCDRLHHFIVDRDGANWFAMFCAYVQISPSELERWRSDSSAQVKARIFDALDGADPGTSNSTPALDTNGRLWFTNFHAIQSIDPAHLPKNTYVPPVYIEQITADRQRYPLETSINLPSATRELDIKYTALSYVIPERVRFRYRLQGQSSQWIDAGTRREAFYNDLKPGTYTFQVIASNNDGVWNERGSVLHFHIAAAWYQTTWFTVAVLGFFLAFAALLYFIDKRRYIALLRMRFNERLEERTRLARELHDTLLQTIMGSKMVVNAARKALGDPVRTETSLEFISRSLDRATMEGRAALDALRGSGIDTGDLGLALRAAASGYMPESMHMESSVSGIPRTMHRVVFHEVYRIGEELIRNASRHSGGTVLGVELRYGKFFTLIVRDNGRGLDPEILNVGRPGHFGLAGMRERAARIRGRLAVATPEHAGTEFILTVPGRVIYRSRVFSRLLHLTGVGGRQKGAAPTNH